MFVHNTARKAKLMSYLDERLLGLLQMGKNPYYKQEPVHLETESRTNEDLYTLVYVFC